MVPLICSLGGCADVWLGDAAGSREKPAQRNRLHSGMHASPAGSRAKPAVMSKPYIILFFGCVYRTCNGALVL